MRASRITWLAALVLVAAGPPALADTIFTDGTFNLGNYALSPPYTSGTSTTVQQCPSCGNPGQALDIVVTATGTSGSGNTYAQGFANTLFSYDPSTQGAIASIGASVDKNLTINFAGSGFGNTFRPLIEQDGTYYLAAIPGASLSCGSGGCSTGYNTLAQSGLTAADFTAYDFATGTFGATHPNFSGDTLLLGLAQITTINEPAGTAVEAQYDNLSFDIVTAVPEPSSLALLGSTLVGLAALRRRRPR